MYNKSWKSYQPSSDWLLIIPIILIILSGFTNI